MRGALRDVGEPRPMPAALTCRRLVPEDVAALGALMAQAYRDSVDDLGEDDAQHLAEAEKTVRGEYGAVVWGASHVAVEEGELVATSLVTDLGRHLLLAFALTVPRWRGRGVGTSLITRSAASLRAVGRTEWTLAVTLGNPAQSLYERLGFRVDESLRIAPGV